MLYQLHWQYRDGTTDIKAQKDITSGNAFRFRDELSLFIKETQEAHSIPNNAIWMVCNEKSEHFIMMKSP